MNWKLFDELKSDMRYDYHNIDTNEYIFGEVWGAINTHPGVFSGYWIIFYWHNNRRIEL